jgi:protein required for attachment to host cells
VLDTFEHPQSRRKASELGDSAAGRELGSRGYAAATHYARVDAREKEQVRFARELAGRLEHEARLNSFHSLSLFVSSPFLGELKRELGDMTRLLLAATHDVDLTSVGMAELEARLAQQAPAEGAREF